MAKDWGFIGGSFPHESAALDGQRTINLYPEVVESGSGKSVKALISIPGLKTFCTLPAGNCRGLFAQDGRAFAVGGAVGYELASGGTVTAQTGALVDDGLPVTWASNGVPGHQLAIASGRRLGIFDLTANTWTPDLRTDADVVAFVDGYFLSLDATISTVGQSDLEDGLTWGGTAKLQRSLGSDTSVTMGPLERMVYLLGSKTSELWYNVGTSPFAFSPFQGGFLEIGCAAADSVATLDASVFWLGTDAGGAISVFRSVGL